MVHSSTHTEMCVALGPFLLFANGASARIITPGWAAFYDFPAAALHIGVTSALSPLEKVAMPAVMMKASLSPRRCHSLLCKLKRINIHFRLRAASAVPITVIIVLGVAAAAGIC
jgi:hypothetical protein